MPQVTKGSQTTGRATSSSVHTKQSVLLSPTLSCPTALAPGQRTAGSKHWDRGSESSSEQLVHSPSCVMLTTGVFGKRLYMETTHRF